MPARLLACQSAAAAALGLHNGQIQQSKTVILAMRDRSGVHADNADDGGDIFALAWGMERVKYMRVSNQKFVEPAERFDHSGVEGGGLPRDS